MEGANYSESKQFWREPGTKGSAVGKQDPPYQVLHAFKEQLIKDVPAGNPSALIDAIDAYAEKTWLMNLGPQKGNILKKILKERQPSNIIQVGGYIGYSALVLASSTVPQCVVHTIEIDPIVAQIAGQLHKHAGLSNRIHIHVGTVPTSQEYIKKHGPFDLVFIDHLKSLYLPDLNILEGYGVIKAKTLVIGDNIIFPGSPDYLSYFKKSKDYNSVLYHTYVQYSDTPDAVLISQKL